MGEPTNELFAVLQQKERISNNVYMDFTEFTRKQIKDMDKQVKQYYSPETQIIGLTELKIQFKENRFHIFLLISFPVDYIT